MNSLDASAFETFVSAEDGEPVVMLNLLRFQPDGGRERYTEYIQKAGPLLGRYGAEILYAGEGGIALCAEPGQRWDAVALVRYPHRQAFRNLVDDPDYHAIDSLRVSALAEAVLQVTEPMRG